MQRFKRAWDGASTGFAILGVPGALWGAVVGGMAAAERGDDIQKALYSFQFLIDLDDVWSDNSFNAEEIEKQYRLLALENHPDRPNGSRQKFEELSKHYNILLGVLKEKEKRVLEAKKKQYTKKTCLGAGTGGMVYLYENKQTKKKVAIKQIYSGDKGFDEARKEIMNLEKLNSPYIVKLIDHFNDPESNLYHLVMEYCSGGSLKGKIFDDDELLVVAKHVLDGLAYMHGQGYIHRDIKPDNLLCCDDQKECVYKLGDLGSSKNVEHSVKTFAGTQTFMAPEIMKLKGSKLQSGKHYDNKADVWSFGATLLSLGESSLCTIESNPTFKRIKNEKLRILIRKCLIYDRNMRPSVDTLKRFVTFNGNVKTFEWNDALMPIQEMGSLTF